MSLRMAASWAWDSEPERLSRLQRRKERTPGLPPRLAGSDRAEQFPQAVAVGHVELARLHPQAERRERALGRVVGVGGALRPARECLPRKRDESREEPRPQVLGRRRIAGTELAEELRDRTVGVGGRWCAHVSTHYRPPGRC